MTFVNLTPHALNVVVSDGSIRVIEPSGSVARCSQTETVVKEVEGIVITKQTFGSVMGLPPQEEGKYLVVSRMVAAACPERSDLLIPGPLVRNEEGVVIGCKGLSVL